MTTAGIYMVLYVAGQRPQAIGPVPGGMRACRMHREEIIGNTDPRDTYRGLTVADVRITCERHERNPYPKDDGR